MTDQTATKQDLRDLKREIVDEISTVLADAMSVVGLSFQGLETRFDGLENRFDGLETRFDGLETRFDEMKNTQGRMEMKLDASIDRLDDHSVRIARLERKHKIKLA